MNKFTLAFTFLILIISPNIYSQTTRPTPLPLGTYQLENFRMRDPNVLVDEKTKTYYIISSNYALNSVGYNSASIRLFSSKDLINWEGPHTIFKRFDGQLMLVLHSPNKNTERAKLFEIEDTGETLRIKAPFNPSK